MADVIGAAEFELRATRKRLSADLAQAERDMKATGEKLERANAGAAASSSRAWEQSARRQSAAVRQAEREIRGSTDAMSLGLKRAAGTIAAGFSVREIVGMTDSYTRFSNALKVAGVEGDNLAKVQNALFASAQKNGVALEPLGQLYGRASQSAKELGASQAQLLQFTGGVTAALRVQGGDASQASGALLQLAQALAAGTVRAEEFNSINEGARPILQAVADGSTRFAGSVSKLRAAVLDGSVTSKEFFAAFLKGSGQLEGQAAKAPLTVAASLTTLGNALTKYIGETDSSLNASARLGAGIKALADNLDTVAPALAVIAVAVGGRYAGAMVTAGVASVRLAAFQTAMTASMMGASRASLLATAAMGRLSGAMAFFGGPIGLAITAVALAIGGLALEANKASANAKALTDELKKTDGALDTAEVAMGLAKAGATGLGDEASYAGREVEILGNKSLTAAQKIMALAGAKKEAMIADLEAQRVKLSEKVSGEIVRTPQYLMREFNQPVRSVGGFFGPVGRALTGVGQSIWSGGRSDRDRRGRIEDGREGLADFDRRIAALRNAPTSSLVDEVKADLARAQGTPAEAGKEKARSNAEAFRDFQAALQRQGIQQAAGRTGFRTTKDQQEIHRHGDSPLDGVHRKSQHQFHRALDPTRASHDARKAKLASDEAGLKGFEVVQESGGRFHYEWTGHGKRGELDEGDLAASKGPTMAEKADTRQDRLDGLADQEVDIRRQAIEAQIDALDAHDRDAQTAEQRATDNAERLKLQGSLRELDAASFERALADAQREHEISEGKSGLSKAEAERLRVARGALVVEQTAAVAAEQAADERQRLAKELAETTERALRSQEEVARLGAEYLGIQADQADTLEKRHEIERELLKLAQEERRRALERRIKEEKLTADQAKAERDGLGKVEAGQTEGLNRAQAGAAQRERLGGFDPVRAAGSIRDDIVGRDTRVEQEAAVYAEIDKLRRANSLSEEQAAEAKRRVWAGSLGEQLSDYSQFFGTLAGLQESGNAKLAAIGKAAAIAEATINGIIAVTDAYAHGGPFPLNLIAAATVGVLAATQVAKIAGFAEGGYVSGPGGPRSDSIPARLSNGEFVMQASVVPQNRSLLEAINAGGLRMPGFADGGIVGRLVPTPSGGSGGRGFTVNFAPVLNAQGAGPNEVAALRREIARMQADMPSAIIATVNDGRQRRLIR